MPRMNPSLAQWNLDWMTQVAVSQGSANYRSGLWRQFTPTSHHVYCMYTALSVSQCEYICGPTTSQSRRVTQCQGSLVIPTSGCW
jgi:hypothetical protein